VGIFSYSKSLECATLVHCSDLEGVLELICILFAGFLNTLLVAILLASKKYEKNLWLGLIISLFVLQISAIVFYLENTPLPIRREIKYEKSFK
jgi:hypothetical protein